MNEVLRPRPVAAGKGRGDAGRLSRILDHLYEAVVSDAAWRGLLATVADALPGTAVALHGVPVEGGGPGLFCGRRGPEFAESYARRYHALDPWRARRLNFAPGSVYFAEDVLPHAELIKTEFYQRWLKPQKLESWVGASLVGLGFNPLFFDIYLPLRAANRDRARVHRVMLILRPHLLRALRLHGAFQARRVPATTGDSQGGEGNPLAHVPLPAAVFDSRRRVVYSNTLIVPLLGQPSNGGAAGIEDLPSANLLAAGLDQALFHGSVFGPFVLHKDGNRFVGTIVPYAFTSSAPEAGEPPHAAMFLFEKGSLGLAQKHELIGRVFGLTQSESALALGLASGKTLSDYAVERRISLNTAKSQLASVFAKTNTARQAELVLLTHKYFDW